MKKIIITGISGFIGSALADQLLPFNINDEFEEEYSIVGIDRMNWKNQNGRLFYHQDINDPLPDIDEVYAVVHLAAKAGVRNSHELFSDVCKDNILGTHNIIKKCIEQWKPKRLIIASSSAVYGNNSGNPSKETDQRKPLSPYAMSKCATEDIAMTYINNGLLDNTKCSILRIFTVYGPNQREGLAIKKFIDSILKNEPVPVFGTGNQRRDFTYIDDLCKGIKDLLDPCELENTGIIYNVGNERNYSLHDIIYMICEYTGKTVSIDYKPKLPWDCETTLSNSRKAYYDFDWNPQTKMEDGLRKQIEWQKRELGL